jgi:Xaa-Pro aminopeptidase
MLRKEDLVFSKETFAARRKKLMDQIGPGSIIIIPSSMPQKRNADNDHPFRQDSNFYYLTGFSEPQAVAIFIPGRKEGEYILFNRVRDPHMETFTGPRAGQEGAVTEFGANEAFDIALLEKKLYDLCDPDKEMKIYYPMGGCHTFFPADGGASLEQIFNQVFRKRYDEILSRNAEPFTQLDPSKLIHQMRLIKEPMELAFMQNAIDISIQGHMRTLQATPYDKQNEMTLSGQFLNEIMHHDTQEVAYPNIVGAGNHSCTLHYQKNDSAIHEYKNYASDITRTFPINGKFTPAQRAIYDVVLETQQMCIDAVKPGVSLLDIHNLSIKGITAGLVKLGILKGDLDNLIKDKAFSAYYMHGVGHWLGMDVHDTSIITGKTPLQPGMVITVEPGIYIAHPEELDPEWHEIGVRIEDDVLVTETGCTVMSAALPRKADEIECVMQGWIPPAVAKLGYQRHGFFAGGVLGQHSQAEEKLVTEKLSGSTAVVPRSF